MQIISVVRYKSPTYPDKDTILHNPNILKTLPVRWTKNAAAVTALSATVAMMLTGCQKSSIVPFFEHGDGRGSFGCMSIAPVDFLSEEEAYVMITELLKEEGLDFQKNVCSVYMTLPNRKLSMDAKGFYNDNSKLLLDGFIEEKKIGFEYISIEDCNYESGIGNIMSFSTLDTAHQLNDNIKNADTGLAIATFYDPIASYADRDKAKADLKLQVKDFIKWLKAQDII